MACWQGCHICLGRETAWVQHSFSRALNREPIHVVGHRTESPTDQPVFSNNPLPSFSGGASARLDLWISCVWRECESDPSLENGELWQIWAFALHMPPQCWLEKLLQRLLYEVSVKHSVLFSFFSVSVKCNKTVNKLFYSIYFRAAWIHIRCLVPGVAPPSVFLLHNRIPPPPPWICWFMQDSGSGFVFFTPSILSAHIWIQPKRKIDTHALLLNPSLK